MVGTVCMTTHGSRAVGMFCNSSSVTLVVVVCRLMSMIGVAAVTLTVSAVPATRELDGERRRLTRSDLHTRVGERVEAGERRLDRVIADREIQEVRLALCVGDLRLIDRASEIHVDARQSTARRVFDRHIDAALESLG
jgi:hypothetical protein